MQRDLQQAQWCDHVHRVVQELKAKPKYALGYSPKGTKGGADGESNPD